MIFIRTQASDGAGGTMDVHMWYDPNTSVVMRYEMLMNGQVLVSSQVVDVQVGVKIDAEMFIPPEDIVFTEW
jgi:outer membrane lipoprotein-sorting protein